MVMCKHCFQRVRHLFFIFCQQQSHIGSPYFGKQVTIRSVYFVRITGTNPSFQDRTAAAGRFSDIIPPPPQCDPARMFFEFTGKFKKHPTGTFAWVLAAGCSVCIHFLFFSARLRRSSFAPAYNRKYTVRIITTRCV